MYNLWLLRASSLHFYVEIKIGKSTVGTPDGLEMRSNHMACRSLNHLGSVRLTYALAMSQLEINYSDLVAGCVGGFNQTYGGLNLPSIGLRLTPSAMYLKGCRRLRSWYISKIFPKLFYKQELEFYAIFVYNCLDVWSFYFINRKSYVVSCVTY